MTSWMNSAVSTSNSRRHDVRIFGPSMHINICALLLQSYKDDVAHRRAFTIRIKPNLRDRHAANAADVPSFTAPADFIHRAWARSLRRPLAISNINISCDKSAAISGRSLQLKTLRKSPANSIRFYRIRGPRKGTSDISGSRHLPFIFAGEVLAFSLSPFIFSFCFMHTLSLGCVSSTPRLSLSPLAAFNFSNDRLTQC